MLSLFSKTVLVPLLLRLGLAAVFVYHGLDLVGGPSDQWGAAWNTTPDAPAAPVQLAVAWGELIGGISLALGFLTRLAALGIGAIMAGAIRHVHLDHGFDITEGGYEYNIILIVMSACLILGGPGPVAVDRFFRLKRKENP